MKKVMKVIREAHNVERKRRQTARKKKEVETKARTQRAKSLIASVKGGRMTKDDIERSLEAIFGNGSSKEIEGITARERGSWKELKRCPRPSNSLKSGRE